MWALAWTKGLSAILPDCARLLSLLRLQQHLFRARSSCSADVVVMSDGCNVLTEDVAERPLLHVHLNTMPSPHHQIPSLTPFPQAAHRKESKVK